MTPTGLILAAVLLLGCSAAASAQAPAPVPAPAQNSPAVAADQAPKPPADVCANRKPDPTVAVNARELGIELLNGNLAFPQQFQTYYDGLLNVPDGSKKRLAFLLELHCIDQLDVLLNVETGEFRIDTWKIQATAALVRLKDHADTETVAAVEKQVTELLAKDDYEAYCAHFNRLGRVAEIPFQASIVEGAIKIAAAPLPPRPAPK